MQNVATEDIVFVGSGHGNWGGSSRDWAFELGRCATHIDKSMPSLVMTRQRTRGGTEIYGVRSFALVDIMRDRMMLGDALVAVELDSATCDDCLLHDTSLCPMAA